MYRVKLYIVPEESSSDVNINKQNVNIINNNIAPTLENKLYDVTSEASDAVYDMNSCFPPLAALSLHGSQPKTSAPTSRIEVLQDLDLYYIKQIAHNLKELDLEQKIEVEIKMREGTTKLLAACKHQAQSLEAAKSLLTSNERMSAYMAELQRRKRQQVPNGSDHELANLRQRYLGSPYRDQDETSETTVAPIETLDPLQTQHNHEVDPGSHHRRNTRDQRPSDGPSSFMGSGKICRSQSVKHDMNCVAGPLPARVRFQETDILLNAELSDNISNPRAHSWSPSADRSSSAHPKSCLSRGRSPSRHSSTPSLQYVDDSQDSPHVRTESVSPRVKPLYLNCPLPTATLRFVDKSPDFYVVTSDQLSTGRTYQYQDVCFGQPMRIRPIGCKARLCLSDLRMPLIWRDTDHFKNKGDYRRFAVFCLAKVGTEMFDTSLLCPVDRSLTDLTFPDILVFNQVPLDFTFTLEVYSHMLRDDMSIASTRRKIKNTIHTSISRTVGKKLAASLRDELNSGKIGPHFELMASARLTLDEVSDSVRTHDLKLEHTDIRNGDALPLFGHFCCRLAAQPECMTRDVVSSTLVNGYASLQAFNLRLWRDRQHWLQGTQPLAQAGVDRDTVIKCTKNGNDLIIVNEIEGKEESLTLKLVSPEDREMWLTHLTEHIKDNERWKGAAEKIMEIYTPGAAKNSFQKTYRQGSLYDETPLIDTNNENAEYTRPTVQDIFGLTPSTSLSSCSSSSSPTFRERSLSSGGSNKSRTRSHWPFSRNNHD